jgi:hypothetical protein
MSITKEDFGGLGYRELYVVFTWFGSHLARSSLLARRSYCTGSSKSKNFALVLRSTARRLQRDLLESCFLPYLREILALGIDSRFRPRRSFYSCNPWASGGSVTVSQSVDPNLPGFVITILVMPISVLKQRVQCSSS